MTSKFHHEQAKMIVWYLLERLGWEVDDELIAGGAADLYVERDGVRYWIQVKSREPENLTSPFITIGAKQMDRYLKLHVQSNVAVIIVSDDLKCDDIEYVLANSQLHTREGYFWTPTRNGDGVWPKEPMRHTLQGFFR